MNRFQRSRKRGWRKPPGAVIVTRPYTMGNPFTEKEYGRLGAIYQFVRMMSGRMDDVPRYKEKRVRITGELGRLVGADVVCACHPDDPCHGDVLLALALAYQAGRDAAKEGRDETGS